MRGGTTPLFSFIIKAGGEATCTKKNIKTTYHKIKSMRVEDWEKKIMKCVYVQFILAGRV